MSRRNPPTAETTMTGRRNSRFVFAKKRIRSLRDTDPKFTPEQIEALISLLRGEDV